MLKFLEENFVKLIGLRRKQNAHMIKGGVHVKNAEVVVFVSMIKGGVHVKNAEVVVFVSMIKGGVHVKNAGVLVFVSMVE
jgi:hypothetical protein